MYGATRYTGFSQYLILYPSFIQCAALLLDQDKVHNDVKIFQKSISRFKIRNFQFLCIDISEAMELVSPRLLEAVEQAQSSVDCYHARLNNVTCADVGHAWFRSVELLTRMWRIHFWRWRGYFQGKMAYFYVGKWRTSQLCPHFFNFHFYV